MASNVKKFKEDLGQLVSTGATLLKDLSENKDKANVFTLGYQNWYSEAQEIIKQLLPNRLEEFNQLYNETKRKLINSSTFSIKDWLLGVRSSTDYLGNKVFDDYAAAVMRLQSQVSILKSIERRFESSLFDVQQIVQADLFDSELDAARELNKLGFARCSGAIAGVVLEKHLTQVCDNRNINISKRDPGINDYNQTLKDNGVIDVKDWRFIQHLADLRNLCDHNKKKEPSKIEVADLIEGVGKITKTIL